MKTNLLSSEISRFIITGLLAVSTDLLSYFMLVEQLPINTAKGTSFILGSLVAFFLNKIWTFKNQDNITPRVIQFSILYTSTLCANIYINEITLTYILDHQLFAFICATGTSTVLNFIGMKYWVFTTSRRSA
jgi:putative flippase GtrA